MATYSELKEQIRLLTEQAELARKEEWASVIGEINKKIAEYQIKPSDLDFPTEGNVITKKEGGRKSLPIKYRHPENPSLTWTGRGKTPSWLVQASSEPGYVEENYLV